MMAMVCGVCVCVCARALVCSSADAFSTCQITDEMTNFAVDVNGFELKCRAAHQVGDDYFLDNLT